MELRLKVLEGKHAGREIRISGAKFLIGRSEECQLRPSSDSISRRHCELQIEDGRATVRDLGSRNGTLVNEERVDGAHVLKTGDLLTIGALRFEVNLTTDLAARKQPIVRNVKEAATRTHEAAAATVPDVESWLASADPTTTTHELSTTDTQKMSLSDTSPGLDPATIVNRAANAEDAEKEASPKKKGRIQKPTSLDGGAAAAADILSRLRKYR
jgi:pSer/pThr/pTyr-binding forkhead associated (FHA) protein